MCQDGPGFPFLPIQSQKVKNACATRAIYRAHFLGFVILFASVICIALIYVTVNYQIYLYRVPGTICFIAKILPITSQNQSTPYINVNTTVAGFFILSDKY